MESSPSSRRVALIAVSLTSFFTPFMASSVNIALPGIGEEFGMSAVLLSWVATVYSLAAAVLLVPLGKLADIHGRKKAYCIGVGLFSLGSALCAAAPGGALLVAFRLLQGAGSAMIFGTGIAILTAVFPPEKRGQVLGINTSVVYAGSSTGPFLGGVLVGQLGWRSIFWVVVPLGVAALVFTALKLEGAWAGAAGERFDLPGAGLYGLAVIAVMVGFSRVTEPLGVGLLLGGLVAGYAFLRHEDRVGQPILDLNLFRGNRTFSLSSVAALTNYAATASVAFLLSLYLQYLKGMSPQRAGSVLIAQPVVMACLSPLAGRLSDRVEPRIVASAGMALTIVGLLLLAGLGDATPMGYVIAALVVLGLGFALFSSPNVSAIMGSVGRQHLGVAGGMVSTMRLFGQMLSMGVAMLLFALYIGPVQITPPYYGAFLVSARTNFIVSALLCLGGLFASLARGRVHGER